MITGLDHTQITIPAGHEEQAREFYCQFLGLSEIEKPDSLKPKGGLWIRVQNAQVHISIEDGVDRINTKAHIAYRVSGIDKWKEKLSSRNIKVTDGTPIPGANRFEFRDPFGNRVEFIEFIFT